MKVNNRWKRTVCTLLMMVTAFSALQGCGDSVNGTEEETTIAATEESTEDPTFYDLKKDEIPAVNDLANAYFTAMKTYDAEAYARIVIGSSVTKEKLESRGTYIEDYRNISCYTKPGMTEGSYVVYVYYEIKFLNIDTLSPGLSLMYIITDAEGNLRITSGNLDPAMAEYLNTVNRHEDVLALNRETDRKQKEAEAADEKLALFMELLRGQAVYVPETSAAPTEENIEEMAFEDRDETVTTTTKVRYRSTPTTITDDNILGSIAAGEKVKRIGYNDSWSKVRLDNGDIVYMSSDFLIN